MKKGNTNPVGKHVAKNEQSMKIYFYMEKVID